MAKCDCYYQHGMKFLCYGTKEMEECSCGGDTSKCDFYLEKRKPKVQKMANCEACKELSKVYDGSQQLITAKFTNKKTGNPTFILVQEKYKEEPQSVTIEVNYCPWCGRYLRGTEDGK